MSPGKLILRLRSTWIQWLWVAMEILCLLHFFPHILLHDHHEFPHRQYLWLFLLGKETRVNISRWVSVKEICTRMDTHRSKGHWIFALSLILEVFCKYPYHLWSLQGKFHIQRRKNELPGPPQPPSILPRRHPRLWILRHHLRHHSNNAQQKIRWKNKR